MKIKWLLSLAVLIDCGVVFAASSAKQTLSDGGDLAAAVVLAKSNYAASSDPQEICLEAGIYRTEAEITLDFPVRIYGATGNPAEVTIEAQAVKKTAIYRVFTINHESARVESVTITGGRLYRHGNNYYNDGAGFRIAAPRSDTQPDHSLAGSGGTVTNCIITGNHAPDRYSGGAAFLIWSPNAVVTHCVVTNNSCTRQLDGSKTDRGAIVDVTSGRFANSLVKDNSVSAPDLNTSGSPDDHSSIVGVGEYGRMENCAVVGNHIGTSYDPVMVCINSAGGKVVNTLVGGNTIDAGAKMKADWDPRREFFGGVDLEAFTYCAFMTNSLPTESCVEISPSDFFDFTSGDLRLRKSSRLRGAGTVEGVAATAFDLAGNARQTEAGKIDIGAYAYAPGEQFAKVSEIPASCWDDDALDVGFAVFEGLEATEDFRLERKTPEGETVETVYGSSPSFALSVPAGEWVVFVSYSNKTDSAWKEFEVGKVESTQRKYYAKAGNATAAHPYGSETTAAADIQSAIDAAPEGAEVVVLPGVYEITTGLFITNRISVCGKTGNAGDVIVRNVYAGAFNEPDNTGHGRCCLIDADPSAMLASVTLEESKVGGTYTMCGALYIGKNTVGTTARQGWYKTGGGGTVSNVVIRNSTNGGCKFSRGVALCAVGANAFITHCTVTNNTSTACFVNGGLQSAFVELEGGAKMEHSFIAFNRSSPGSKEYPTGRLQSAVSLGGDSSLKFCTVVSNSCSLVGGVNVRRSSGASVKYCIIAGNGAFESTGSYQNPQPRHSDWGMFALSQTGDVFGNVSTPLGGGVVADAIAEEIAFVEDNGALVESVFVGNVIGSAAAGATDTVAPLSSVLTGFGVGRIRPRGSSPARDRVTAAEAGEMPAVDVSGSVRLVGGRYDVGCHEGAAINAFYITVK